MALPRQQLELPQPIGIGLGDATERQEHDGAAAERVGILRAFGNGPVEGLQGLGMTAQGHQRFAFCHEQVGLIGPQLQRHFVVEKRKPRPSRREIGVPARHIDKSAPLRRSSPQHVGIAIDLGHRRRAMTHEERAVRHSSFQELACRSRPLIAGQGPFAPTQPVEDRGMLFDGIESRRMGFQEFREPPLRCFKAIGTQPGQSPAGSKAPAWIPDPAAGASPRPRPPSTCARLARPPVRPEPPVRRSAPEASTRASTCLSVEMPLRAVTDGRSVGCPDHGIELPVGAGLSDCCGMLKVEGRKVGPGPRPALSRVPMPAWPVTAPSPAPTDSGLSQAYGRHDEAVVVLADLRTAVAGARRWPGGVHCLLLGAVVAGTRPPADPHRCADGQRQDGVRATAPSSFPPTTTGRSATARDRSPARRTCVPVRAGRRQLSGGLLHSGAAGRARRAPVGCQGPAGHGSDQPGDRRNRSPAVLRTDQESGAWRWTRTWSRSSSMPATT